ncbi:hypothetical protein [Sphingomonas sp. 37zxx]|uniref:hypothetical protein n=1 Tax=Sphingomonas sp. 37zxx TaxID=1550073 RepID=UPI000691D59A|nr:hypothetical protein [Sphingomonas sp. 37zxx]
MGLGIWPALAILMLPPQPQQVADTDARALRSLTQCRTITDPNARLACFDRESAALETAVSTGDVIALDREEVRTARRSLFGFAAPITRVFSGREKPEAETDREDVDRLESTIKSARQLARGRWRIELEDGAVWVQNDDRKLAIYPKTGQTIAIRKAALGSYLANIQGQTAIRVQRQQ